jgi:N-acetylmuramoyl-L-alanine amidase
MTRNSTVKMAVLRGVYEDNAGIPRSCHGKRRSGLRDPVIIPSMGRWSKMVALALLGLIALIGMNFRVVTVDVSAPLAVHGAQERLAPSAPEHGTSVSGGQVGTALSSDPGPDLTLRALNSATGTRDYSSMLSGLDMPLAELFDLNVKTIVVDPGHGGIDPGATGHGGLQEKDVVLDIARRLRDKLVASGRYHVLLTREDDRKVFLKERVAFAQDKRADLFISIHINSVPAEAGSLNYVETYYFGPHTDQQSLQLAEMENRDSDYALGDFREVIARIGDTLKSEESQELARSMHQHLYHNLKSRSTSLVDAGFKTGPFMVLLGVEMPSVLVEVSCISNTGEEARLSMPEYRDAIADYLKAGIVEYLDRSAYRKSIDRGEKHYVASQER